LKSVAIIGAGITGLTAAFYLKRKGIPVTVYEASGRVGGVIQSLRQDGYLAEFGPNTLLETSPKIAQLVRDAGLQSRRLDPDPKAEARYVVRYQRPIAMPGSPLGFLTTKLFTAKAKLAVLREPFVAPRRDGVEESIAQFVVRRLNQEFLDHAIDALVAGIYAGDPHRLSLTHAFPKLKALEDNYGSLIKGQIFGAGARKRSGEVAKDRAPKFSFDEGLQVLPDTLAVRLGDTVKLNTSVTKLTQTTNGWTLTLSEGRVTRALETGDSWSSSLRNETQAEHSAVIYCGTAFRLAELQIELQTNVNVPLAPALSPFGGEREKTATGDNTPSPRTSGERVAGGRERGDFVSLDAFSEIRYPPVASVVLGFRREDVTHPCEGFGMLIPKIEGFKILGTIFSSSLFPNRAPAGHLTLTSYIGGERYPELALLPAEKLVALTCEDLRVLLGVSGKPIFQHCVLYPKAIPQYNVGYGRYRGLMTEIENKAAGLFFAGHYRDGVSLGDTIVSGVNIVERVTTFLKTTDEH
jgi:oxygen-dependent protoporphyrinogen oxidase